MRKEPSRAQAGRVTGVVAGGMGLGLSPSRPRRIVPCGTKSWPGKVVFSTPVTAGCETPSRKPKLEKD